MVQIFLFSVIALFFILLLLLYRRANFEKKYAQSILNATPNLIIITDGKELISANNAFLNFIGYETLEAFKNEHDCICDFFEEGDTDEYLVANMNEKTWIEYILEHPECECKAKITMHNKTRLFKVSASVVESGKLFRVIAIFDDISELINKSTMDALTQIANRMHFNLLFEYALTMSQREQTPLCMIFFDIDHFKAVNDTFGHSVGDDVLRHLADLVKNSLRKSDIIARWGGEEFVILLPNTSLSFAIQIADGLRLRIQEEPFEAIGHVTCSFGVTEFRDNETGDTFLQRVDALLYKAKERGRNRVEEG